MKEIEEIKKELSKLKYSTVDIPVLDVVRNVNFKLDKLKNKLNVDVLKNKPVAVEAETGDLLFKEQIGRALRPNSDAVEKFSHLFITKLFNCINTGAPMPPDLVGLDVNSKQLKIIHKMALETFKEVNKS